MLITFEKDPWSIAENNLLLNDWQAEKDVAEKLFKALVQCAKNQNQFVSNDDSFESTIDVDELTFGLVDTITKKFEELVHKIRCSVGVIGEVIGDGDLKNVFEEFKNDVMEFLKADITQCAQAKGLTGKLK